jgi:hypothetical protein
MTSRRSDAEDGRTDAPVPEYAVQKSDRRRSARRGPKPDSRPNLPDADPKPPIKVALFILVPFILLMVWAALSR